MCPRPVSEQRSERAFVVRKTNKQNHPMWDGEAVCHQYVTGMSIIPLIFVTDLTVACAINFFGFRLRISSD